MTQVNLQAAENFGGIAADDDPILIDAFEEHEAYLGARDFKTSIIIGRKGSGKTAIFKKIQSTKSHDNFSIGLTFRNYPWDHHNLQKQSGVSTEECYRGSWVYFICLCAASIVMEDESTSVVPHNQELHAQIRSFLRDSFGGLKADFTSIFSPQRKFKFGGKFNLSTIGLNVDYVEAKELPKFYSQINDFMLDCIIRCMNGQHHYYLCFDELDFGFELENKDYYYRLIGLIRAAMDINRKAKELGKKFSVIIFLRDDIYETINFEDKNKIRPPTYMNISWQQDGKKNTLKELMEKRFKVVYQTDYTVRWEDIFDDKQIRGRQNKYNYICNRTFLRPRDIIAFCNFTLAYHNSKKNIEKRFVNEDILKGEMDYSKFLIRSWRMRYTSISLPTSTYLRVLE